jgi:hypothetical protein
LPVDDVTLALALLAVAAAIAMLLVLPISEGTLSPASWLRAKRLFLSKLSDAERRRWATERRLTVVGSSGRRYTLAPYEAFNIRAGTQEYCLRVVGWLPAYDKLLAQRLLVESDEPAFLAIANRRALQGDARPFDSRRFSDRRP